MTSTNYGVFASVDGKRRRAAVLPDYDKAIALWSKLQVGLDSGKLVEVDLKPQGRRNLGIARRIDKDAPVRPTNYLVVRSMDDPGWQGAEPIRLAVLASGKGSKDVDASVRLLARDLGVHGHEGGWMYIGGTPGHIRGDHGCRRLPYQGWASWWYHRGDPMRLVSIDGRFHRTIA